MCLCWSHDQSDRPSAQEIIDIASRPEFSHLKDVVCIDGQVDVLSACSSPVLLETDTDTGIMFLLVLAL